MKVTIEYEKTSTSTIIEFLEQLPENQFIYIKTWNGTERDTSVREEIVHMKHLLEEERIIC